ncbi:MAG: hypothetical protein JWQ84_850 [Mucilaginibacter sp.]|nr:hypothetical protein [Mucilaginibacter sp.]MDB5016018.1 hypothetical protein [Mucilaginibacter sp.]
MIKWFAYIVVLLIFAPYLLSAEIKNSHSDNLGISLSSFKESLTDTIVTKKTKKQEQEDKKIKEVAKAKKQPKPEKIEPESNTATSNPKQRPKRQRRPEGLERPPEIPRRNGN